LHGLFASLSFTFESVTFRIPSIVGWVYNVAFWPDGSRLAFGFDDGIVQVWNVATGQVETLEGNSGWVYSVAFSPDGSRLALGSGDGNCEWEGEGP
jgi:WD40 repeat protein